MLTDMQGGRYDGQQWPGFHGLIDVPEWEAERMTCGANPMAEYTDVPELNRSYDVLKEPSLDYEQKLKFADGSSQEEEDVHQDAEDWGRGVEEAGTDDDDFERDEEPEVTPPTSADNKAAWVDYAVANGAVREDAEAKTKAQLVSEYKN